MLTERDAEIATLAIQGTPQREIAGAAGITQQRVSQILDKKEVRAIVDRAQERIAVGAEIAAENMVESAQYYNDFIKKTRKGEKPEQEPDRQLIDLGFKASKEIGKSTGSLSGDNVSIYVQNNVLNDHRSMEMPPEIARLLKHQRAGEVYDVEYGEI